MNEADTRAEYIDPKLKESGWGVVEGSKILREFHITDGRIQVGHQEPVIQDANFASKDCDTRQKRELKRRRRRT